MNYEQLISNVLTKVGHPGGTELISKADVIFYVNNALAFIEGQADWYFLKLTKTIAPASAATIFTLPVDLFRAYSVKGQTGTATTPLTEKATQYGYVVEYGTVTTTEAYESLVIHGKWEFPELVNSDAALRAEIALPKQLVAACYFFTLGQALEVYLDTGFQLTEYYYGMSKKFCEIAAQSHVISQIDGLVPRR